MSSKYIRISIVLLFVLALAIPSNAQSAPSEAGIPPYPGAPLCPTHNDTIWHALWDDQRGCHYNHTHNDNPAQADFLFGAAGAAWGQSISYPFMTANENNAMGHTGYKYDVNLGQGLDCPQDGYDYLNPDPNCIEAFRVQYHDVGGNAHMVKRFHSYYMEVQVQSRDDKVTGIVQFGGYADFGCLHGSYKEFFVPLPGIDPVNSNGQSVCGTSQSLDLDPYRSTRTVEEIANIRAKGSDNMATWTSHDRYGYNKFGYFFFRTLDTWGGMDKNDPYTDQFVCAGQPNCRYNNSVANVFTVAVIIPSSLDTDGDGIVNYTGYTDLKGNIAQGCTAPSANCVPLKIVNAPVGMAVWKPGGGIRPTGEVIDDFDIYFNGQPSGWIEFPGGAMPPMSPMPTNTPPSSGPFVSTEVNPSSLSIGGTGLVSVRLNNAPVEGYKSAEFLCTYNAGYGASLVEVSNIAAANLFGADSAVAVHDPQNGSFIVAIAGTNGNKATTSGPVFTFNVKGLQAGQSMIQCAARVSKGDNVPIDLASTGASLTILGVEPSPTPFGFPTLPPDGSPQPTTTNTPLESPTPTASFTPLPTPDGLLTGHVIASKAVTVSLFDANNVVITSVVANPDGTFSLTALAGNYTVVALSSGFLSHQGSAIITAGNTTGRPTISLLAGDIDGNNVIDQFDALTIGMSYNTVTPSAADLNNDGTINFLDLELLAENYRKTGPSAW